MIDKGPVLLDITDGIARLRLNRPDAANGMSAELLSALCDAIMVCHGHSDLRVVLLSATRSTLSCLMAPCASVPRGRRRRWTLHARSPRA